MHRPQDPILFPKINPSEKKRLLESPWRERPQTVIDLGRPTVHRQFQAYCTCGKCIAGYISPRMRWLMMRKSDIPFRADAVTQFLGYASIYKDLLPRTLSAFEDGEGVGPQDTPLNDFDAFSDLNHLPVSLRRSMHNNIRVMHGYCEVFAAIEKCLLRNQEPTPAILKRHIDYSWSDDYKDASDFFDAGGMPQHALQYLLFTLRKISLVRHSAATLEAKLGHLGMCSNDTGYDMVSNELLKHANSCKVDRDDVYTHVFELKPLES
jgi:hypothetical protein